MNNSEIPKNILEVIQSSKLYDKLEDIGKRYDLMLDQVGQLEVDTRMTMVGKLKSSQFVKTISKNLEISEDVSQKIAKDINTEIFDPIRESLQKIQDRAESELSNETVSEPPTNLPTGTISDIEKAGDFTVDQQPSSSSDQYNDANITKEEVLKGIEDQPIPMVDHLLTTPVSAPQQVEVKKVVEKAPVKAPEKKGYTADPYREAI